MRHNRHTSSWTPKSLLKKVRSQFDVASISLPVRSFFLGRLRLLMEDFASTHGSGALRVSAHFAPHAKKPITPPIHCQRDPRDPRARSARSRSRRPPRPCAEPGAKAKRGEREVEWESEGTEIGSELLRFEVLPPRFSRLRTMSLTYESISCARLGLVLSGMHWMNTVRPSKTEEKGHMNDISVRTSRKQKPSAQRTKTKRTCNWTTQR